jgi:hypothetical protein
MCPWAQSQARTKSSAYSGASGRNGRRQSRPPTARSLAVVPAASITSGGHPAVNRICSQARRGPGVQRFI